MLITASIKLDLEYVFDLKQSFLATYSELLSDGSGVGYVGANYFTEPAREFEVDG